MSEKKGYEVIKTFLELLKTGLIEKNEDSQIGAQPDIDGKDYENFNLKSFMNAYYSDARGYWNSSVKGLYDKYNSLDNDRRKIGEIAVEDIKDADAGYDFSGEPWVRPEKNLEGKTYSQERDRDKLEEVLNDNKQLQFTASETAKYIRLIMPKYTRRVEIEDLDRNFWVIGQVLAALSKMMLDPDSLLNQILKQIISEIVQLWDNTYRIWQAIKAVGDKITDLNQVVLNAYKGASKVGVIFLYQDSNNSAGTNKFGQGLGNTLPAENDYVSIEQLSNGNYVAIAKKNVIITSDNIAYMGLLPYVRKTSLPMGDGANNCYLYYLPYNKVLSDSVIKQREDETEDECENRLELLFSAKYNGGQPLAVDKKNSPQTYQEILKEIRGLNFTLVSPNLNKIEAFEKTSFYKDTYVLSILQRARNVLFLKAKKTNYDDAVIDGRSMDYWSNCLANMTFDESLVANHYYDAEKYFVDENFNDDHCSLFFDYLKKKYPNDESFYDTLKSRVNALGGYLVKGRFTNKDGYYENLFPTDYQAMITIFKTIILIADRAVGGENPYTPQIAPLLNKPTLSLYEVEDAMPAATKAFSENFKRITNFNDISINNELIVIDPSYLIPIGSKIVFNNTLVQIVFDGGDDSQQRVDVAWDIISNKLRDMSFKKFSGEYYTSKTLNENDIKTEIPSYAEMNTGDTNQNLAVRSKMECGWLGIGQEDDGWGTNYLYPSDDTYSAQNLFGYWCQFHADNNNAPMLPKSHIRSFYFNEYGANSVNNTIYHAKQPGHFYTLTSYNLDITIPVEYNDNGQDAKYGNLAHFGIPYPSVKSIAVNKSKGNLDQRIESANNTDQLYYILKGYNDSTYNWSNEKNVMIDGFLGHLSSTGYPNQNIPTQVLEKVNQGFDVSKAVLTSGYVKPITTTEEKRAAAYVNRRIVGNSADEQVPGYVGPNALNKRSYAILSSDIVNTKITDTSWAKTNMGNSIINVTGATGSQSIVFNISFEDAGTSYQALTMEIEKQRLGQEVSINIS